jgi:hypothetical protein
VRKLSRHFDSRFFVARSQSVFSPLKDILIILVRKGNRPTHNKTEPKATRNNTNNWQWDGTTKEIITLFE